MTDRKARFGGDPSTTTLLQAKDWLRTGPGGVPEAGPMYQAAGAVCPCCSQDVKVYARTITSACACGLVFVYRHGIKNGFEEWVHVPSLWHELRLAPRFGAAFSGGDWAKLRFWKIIEPRPEGERDDGSERTGYWRLTELGRRFVNAEVQLPKYQYLYNNRPLHESDDEFIKIDDSLGKKFRFDELMSISVSFV